MRPFRRKKPGDAPPVPTVAEGIEVIRQQLQSRGEIVILYFNFDRYSKVEEIYGYEKLDEVLATTMEGIHNFLATTSLKSSRLMVTYANDDDFVLFHVPANSNDAITDAHVTEMMKGLSGHMCNYIESQHGSDIASLFDLFIGHAYVRLDPKVLLERSIYRGIRAAASVSKSVESREQLKKIEDLRELLRTRALYVEYHPIVVAGDRKIFGYEALSRGIKRSLRSPEIMFEVAADANLVWELSRLCREKAIEGMQERVEEGQLLFMNVDPHDFDDPAFTEMEMQVGDPSRVVIEITERTAIKDYPMFRERLQAFRDRGFRFAVDDAGSGYAGLGSIANLEPNFIKLDISLINGIDSNFIKQNLVETMVRFANDHGAMVIAEGVETAKEFETVRSLGVHLVQGFFLHRPQRNGAASGPKIVQRSADAIPPIPVH